MECRYLPTNQCLKNVKENTEIEKIKQLKIFTNYLILVSYKLSLSSQFSLTRLSKKL